MELGYPSKEELQEEYEKCLHFLEREDRKPEDLRIALQANAQLFSKVKKVLQEGSEEDKKAAFGLFTKVLSLFMKEAQRVSGKEGSLDKILESMSSEQKQLFEQAKEKLKVFEKDFMKGIKKEPP